MEDYYEYRNQPIFKMALPRGVIQAFLENGINRTFVCVEHPNFDEAMKALEKANIKVICEGVETEEQNTLVSSSACDFV